MVEYKSGSSFKTPQTVNQQPMRHFSVPEATAPDVQEQLDDIEFATKTARKEKVAQIENMARITEPAKKRIELLANIGRLTRDVKMDVYTFTLRTLKAKETREAAMASFIAQTQLEAGYEIRKQTLARALFRIDGADIGSIIGNDNLEARLDFIENELEEAVVTKLFDEFTILKEEAKNKFGLNTDEQIKEVAEDIKKS